MSVPPWGCWRTSAQVSQTGNSSSALHHYRPQVLKNDLFGGNSLSPEKVQDLPVPLISAQELIKLYVFQRLQFFSPKCDFILKIMKNNLQLAPNKNNRKVLSPRTRRLSPALPTAWEQTWRRMCPDRTAGLSGNTRQRLLSEERERVTRSLAWCPQTEPLRRLEGRSARLQAAVSRR